jgi:SARP family transcriptional regulator, regulator of embCAB operon
LPEDCPDIGKTLAPLRIYLTGRISLEYGETLVEERELAGRQGRLAFAFLASERQRPVTKEELTAIVWPDTPPREIETALNAILSKLRAVLKKAGVTQTHVVEVCSGTIQMRLPSDVWIDLEHAANSIDEAEGALRTGDAREAWSHAVALVIIARRPFLPGEEAPWIEARRARLRSLLVRGLHILSQITAINGEHALAVQYATEIIDLEPFQETGYRHLMQMHAEMGNRGEALRVFGKCRELFKEELGADPSQETERVFLEILRAGQ